MSGLRYWPLVPRFWFSFVVNSRGVVFFLVSGNAFFGGKGGCVVLEVFRMKDIISLDF